MGLWTSTGLANARWEIGNAKSRAWSLGRPWVICAAPQLTPQISTDLHQPSPSTISNLCDSCRFLICRPPFHGISHFAVSRILHWCRLWSICSVFTSGNQNRCGVGGFRQWLTKWPFWDQPDQPLTVANLSQSDVFWAIPRRVWTLCPWRLPLWPGSCQASGSIDDQQQWFKTLYVDSVRMGRHTEATCLHVLYR